MYIPFEQLRDDSRIWVFQADRQLNTAEIEFLSQNLQNFTEQWAAHKIPLNSSYKIEYNTHIIVGVDQAVHDASGCSIDTLMQLMQKLGKEINVDFFDRKSIAYIDGAKAEVASFTDLKDLIQKGEITEDTLIFNNLVMAKELLHTSWKVKAKESWIKRYFKTTLTT